jgi:hypothetical protein
MQECDNIGPVCELVDLRIRDVVGGIETDNALYQCPGPKRPSGKRSDGRGGRICSCGRCGDGFRGLLGGWCRPVVDARGVGDG